MSLISIKFQFRFFGQVFCYYILNQGIMIPGSTGQMTLDQKAQICD